MKLDYKKIIASIVSIAVLDFIFLFTMSGRFRVLVKKVQGSDMKVNYISALICYIILIFVYNYFILAENKGVFDSFLLGLAIYGVYETTTLAIIKDWDWRIAIVDTLWGGVLFALTTFIIQRLF